ncbi:tyrosine-type recombinase/integrase [Streptomyces sp. RPA4-5]|uniref:tyrosine-type recombinase/integrase n=2 Tax=Streptomyces TaxID=1883 RepID=UPI002001E26B|nr:tyrosine-type recombinase/integrase [Streptomyces sp. RPA4-5]
MPANPLTPTKTVRRRHPKMLPDGARSELGGTLRTARDRMTVDWLPDGGFRIGEFCGFYLCDLHLRENAPCGECRAPHVHICHRETNPNRTRVKVKYEWWVEDSTIRGGLIRRVSSEMIHSYFEYMTTEYPADADHGMLAVQLHGPNNGQPWGTAGARGMLRRAGYRVELGRIKPRQFRHTLTNEVLDAADGKAAVARDALGWKSAEMVDEVYGHADIHDPTLADALCKAWGQR